MKIISKIFDENIFSTYILLNVTFNSIIVPWFRFWSLIHFLELRFRKEMSAAQGQQSRRSTTHAPAGHAEYYRDLVAMRKTYQQLYAK